MLQVVKFQTPMIDETIQVKPTNGFVFAGHQSQNTTEQFIYRQAQNGDFTAESLGFRGKFINCPGGGGKPCALDPTPTTFHLNAPIDTYQAILGPDQTVLSIGNLKKKSLSLEKAGSSDKQRFSVVFLYNLSE